MIAGDDPTLPHAAQTRGLDLERVGRFLVLDRLGEGGMGVVYSAYDPDLDRKVAIKLLRDVSADAEARARMQREARVMARLSDPHVVAVHDVGVHDGQLFIAMELIKGGTLRDWMRRTPRTWREIVAAFVDAGKGLAAAHDAGIVHRDFKPENVLVDESGRVRVTDFGLARGDGPDSVETDPRLSDRHSTGIDSRNLTEHGAVLGTPAYMSPEQLMGRASDAKSDQFSLCVALWEALYGARPFAGASLVDLALAVQAGSIRPPGDTRVPGWIEPILRRGLAPKAGDRWDSMAAMVEALGRGQAAARRRSIALGLAAIAVVGGSFEVWRRSELSRVVAACGSEGDAFAQVWPGDEQSARVAVRDGLTAVGSSLAADTVERVEPLLDAYADSWAKARSHACTLARVEKSWTHEDEQRSAQCLDERRAVVAALLARFAAADVTTVRVAIAAVVGLASVEACTDLETLARLPAVPPEDSDRIRTARALLADATALQLAGDPTGATTRASAALDDAVVIAWPPLIAEAHRSLGEALVLAGAYEQAENELVQAFDVASEAGALGTGVDAATGLVYLVGFELGRKAEGRIWSRLASFGLVALGEERELRAARLMFWDARIRSRDVDYVGARQVLERAVALYEELLGDQHPDVARALSQLGIVRRAQGDPKEAIDIFERAVTIQESSLGPDHVDLAATLINLAGARSMLGHYRDAKVDYERALRINEKWLGPDNIMVATSLDGVGNVNVRLGNFAEGKAAYLRALAIKERTLRPDHTDLLITRRALGDALYYLGEHAAAIDTVERALATAEKTFGAEHVAVAQFGATLARFKLATGALHDAERLYERSLATAERVQSSAVVAASLYGLGRVALRDSRPASAVSLFERCIAVWSPHVSASPVELAEMRFHLAMALVAAGGDRPRAILLAEQAAAVLRDLGPQPESDIDLEDVDTWLKQQTP